eukprot:60739_1
MSIPNEHEADEKQLLSYYGYVRGKHLFTPSNNGNIFIAYNQTQDNEPVVIKRINSDTLCSDAYLKTFSTMTVSGQYNEDNPCANCIDFFKSTTHIYFVFEYNFNVNLSEFVLTCREYIKQGKLNANHYHKTMRYLLWRFVQTLSTIKCDSRCNVNNLHMDNIMVRNAEFINNSDGSISIHSEIDIVYINISETIRRDDIFGVGAIMYYCFVDTFPYSERKDMSMDVSIPNNVAWAIANKKLKHYLLVNNLAIFINVKIISLLTSLLNINCSQSFNLKNVLNHPFFNKMGYKKN